MRKKQLGSQHQKFGPQNGQMDSQIFQKTIDTIKGSQYLLCLSCANRIVVLLPADDATALCAIYTTNAISKK